MKNDFYDKTYRAAIYLRLSQEDGDLSSSDKNESNSISTQRDLIHNYLRQHPEIEYVTEFCDDGYTGTNFDRPGFAQMMQAVRERQINCIVVKDLSRFGRDYIESGKYIQKIFPTMGIRFIAINDSFDSEDVAANQANDFILPFKNLINDSYSRDLSIKSRTNLEVKRRNGEFVANYAAFGYKRSPEDKHKLVIDEPAAAVVRDIFSRKQAGQSAKQIADLLNSSGVPSPMEYKRQCGGHYCTSFKTNATAQWTAASVFRILKNAVYTGTLEQGKTTTPNYKVKIVRKKDVSEWARVENAHEAIIPKAQFQLMQDLLRLDTRRGNGAETVTPLAGLVFCADCQNSMYRRNVQWRTQRYYYYNCTGHRLDKGSCTPHSIRCDQVEEAVLATMQAQIKLALDIDKALQQVEALAWEQREIRKINAQIDALELDLARYDSLKADLYADLRSELLCREEYNSFKAEYDARAEETRQQITVLVGRRNTVSAGLTEQQGWFAQFRQYENIQQLDRPVVVALVSRIEVHTDKQITVHFRHADQFRNALDYLKEQGAALVPAAAVEEAV